MIIIKKDIESFFYVLTNYNYYVSKSEIYLLKEKYNYLYKKVKRNIVYLIKYYKFYKTYKNIDKVINSINNEYISSEINNPILNDIKGYELDSKQKEVVVTDEDNILVCAGAGSGKSLTILAKIRYLIEVKNIKEEDMLCISFTKESSKSLKESIYNTYGYNIDVFTFHKLGLNILNYYYDHINICPSNLLEYIVDEIFYSEFSYIKDNNLIYELKKNIVTFIRLFKSKGYTFDKFNELLVINSKNINKTKRRKNEIYLKIIRYFYIRYTEELVSQGLIDFDDMIINSIKCIKENGMYKDYKYIIIDEYQDTSYIRYKLINEIRKCLNSKIIAVGDDFQSIYRFTGCDLDIFLKFSEYYGYTKILKIENTYRNSKELIEVAGNFIMKNKYQIKKNLKSNKSINKPIKIFYYKDIKEDFIKLLKHIYMINKSNILVLGRNNIDINKYLSDNLILEKDKLILKSNKDINIRYLTIHKSKGLEDDNVVIINLEDGMLGFPSKIQNDDIISFVLSNKDMYPYEEERRLFYVALTRTKNNVYIFVSKKHESIFLKEIIINSNKYIEVIGKESK